MVDQLPNERIIRQWCAQARGGSASARERLLRTHLRLIFHVARYFFRPGCFCELEDLVQQGCLGLLHAIEKFDPQKYSRGKSVRFATYAHFWIAHSIRREIENNGRTISIPVHRLQELKAQGRLSQEPATVSFDQTPEWLEDEHGQAWARVVDPHESPEAWCQAWENRQEVERMLKSLPARSQTVLKYRYGLFEWTLMSQQELGEALGVTGAMVGVWERTALQSLKNQAVNRII